MALARIVSNRFSWKYLLTTSNDTSDHTRVCGSLKASLLTHPTQAITAAPGARPVIAGSYPHDRTGSGSSSRKGPDLGGGKVVGVTETVAISGLKSMTGPSRPVHQWRGITSQPKPGLPSRLNFSVCNQNNDHLV